MTLNKSELIVIRPMVDSDKNFVMATILRGLYYGESWFSLINKNVFMSKYHNTIEILLNKPTTEVLVACLKDDPEVILGYSILTLSTNTLHWTFVKKNWRGIGIAKSLVPDTTTNVTHLTKLGISIIIKKNLAFDPFLI